MSIFLISALDFTMDNSLGLSRSDTPIILLLVQPFDDFDKAVEYMRLYSSHFGYAMTKLRSKQPFRDADRQQLFRRNWFRCDRHPVPQSISTGKRKSASRGTGCQFQLLIELEKSESGQKWITRPKNEHNHPSSANIASHHVHRELPNNLKSQILSMSAVGSTPRHIMASVAKYDKNISITPNDIYNLIRNADKEFLNGRTRIQALFDEL